MNKARDLVALAILAFRNGEHDAAAKFFTSAMGSDDLDSFVDEIALNVPRAARNAPVPDSDNTLSPSLASALSDDMADMVDYIESRFRAECSLFDEGDEEVEVRATTEDDEDLEAEASDCSDDDLDDEDLDDPEEDEDDEEEEDEEFEAEASEDQSGHEDVELTIVASAGPVRVK